VTLKVDARKLASVLHVYSANFDSAVACFVGGMSLVVHAFLPVGTVTFYQPVMVANMMEE
jgi:hypothetical protein